MSDSNETENVPVPNDDVVTAENTDAATEELTRTAIGKKGDIGGLILGLIGFGALLNALVGVAYLTGDYAKRAYEIQYHEEVLTYVNPEKGKLTAEDRAAIANYAVVDASNDQYKIPIEHAMHLVASATPAHAESAAAEHVDDTHTDTKDESEQ